MSKGVLDCTVPQPSDSSVPGRVAVNHISLNVAPSVPDCARQHHRTLWAWGFPELPNEWTVMH